MSQNKYKVKIDRIIGRNWQIKNHNGRFQNMSLLSLTDQRKNTSIKIKFENDNSKLDLSDFKSNN